MIIRRLRVALGVVLVAVAGLSLTALVGCVFMLATMPVPEVLLPAEQAVSVALLVWGALGLLALAASVLICWRKRRIDGMHGCRKRWIAAYGVLGLLGAAGLVLLACWLQFGLGRALVERSFDRWWRDASPMVLLQVQRIGQCCGFRDYADRQLSPCQRYEPAVGCWPGMLRAEYYGYLRVLTGLLLATGALQLGAALVAGALLVARLRSGAQAPSSFAQAAMLSGLSTSKDYGHWRAQQNSAAATAAAGVFSKAEPFDAWHQAVFTN